MVLVLASCSIKENHVLLLTLNKAFSKNSWGSSAARQQQRGARAAVAGVE